VGNLVYNLQANQIKFRERLHEKGLVSIQYLVVAEFLSKVFNYNIDLHINIYSFNTTIVQREESLNLFLLLRVHVCINTFWLERPIDMMFIY